MLKISKNKYKALEHLSTNEGFISALAIDQRDSMRKMVSDLGLEPDHNRIEDFKSTISKEMTQYASSILLDPEYGVPAAKVRHEDAGLLLSYEVTGYDKSVPGRYPTLLENWSVRRIKELGADAAKILLYYDFDESDDVNDKKHAFIERVGSECAAEDIPFFLEIVTYDKDMESTKTRDYAFVKPHKVNEAMRVFSDARFQVDVLKMEVPVNMKYVEGYVDDPSEQVYSREEALEYFRQQSRATHLPFIFLSAGVSAELFQETLRFAHEAGSSYNGVLCGRATWKDAVPIYMLEGEDKANAWIHSQGMDNITSLNKVVEKTASSWKDKVIVE